MVNGLYVIENKQKTLPRLPGVYRMLNAKGDALYVGKAKNLKARVSYYTKIDRLPKRLQKMVIETDTLEIITTHTEAEALLLESNLIKQLKPRYNILLKDDKSFSYIAITTEHTFPRVLKERRKKSTNEYFGPFASTGAVNESLTTLQKIFLLRSCSDSVFNNRSRPCLLYQIKRCSAPCVDKVSQVEYNQSIKQTRAFLTGHSSEIQRDLSEKMEEASKNLEYEVAANYRDRIRALTNIQGRQTINFGSNQNIDVIGLALINGESCIQVFFIRNGQNYGNKAYYPLHEKDATSNSIMSAFLGQFYDSITIPKNIILSHNPSNLALITEALSLKLEKKVVISVPTRGTKLELVTHAIRNAEQELKTRIAKNTSQLILLRKLQDLFDLVNTPNRIEVYDNSHISGDNMVGCMIVAGRNGFEKNNYRIFKIKSQTLNPGDDYGAMKEVITRRFTGTTKNNGILPDLLIIDGGKGQLNTVNAVLKNIGLQDVAVVSIAKGDKRNAGNETLYRESHEPFTLKLKDPILYFLQRLRDEAHRFAIASHRNQRSKRLRKSGLDKITGIGAKRKKALLHHFGSLKAISDAGSKDLADAVGIDAVLAQKIYDEFH
ncbi:MAG: excinuclease ABC subunit C [Rhodospirillaceae bacterium]|nr:excinuclease ABC subunit C [Rhodospirillaceae bacterium]